MPASVTIKFTPATNLHDIQITEDALKLCSFPCSLQLHCSISNQSTNISSRKPLRRTKLFYQNITSEQFLDIVQYELKQIDENDTKNIVEFNFIVEELTIDLTGVNESTTIEQILKQYDSMQNSPYPTNHNFHDYPFDAMLIGFSQQTKDKVFTKLLTSRGYFKPSLQETTFLSLVEDALSDVIQDVHVGSMLSCHLEEIQWWEDIVYVVHITPHYHNISLSSPALHSPLTIIEVLQQYQDYVKQVVPRKEFVAELVLLQEITIHIDSNNNNDNNEVIRSSSIRCESIQLIGSRVLTTQGFDVFGVWNTKMLQIVQEIVKSQNHPNNNLRTDQYDGNSNDNAIGASQLYQYYIIFR